MGNTVTVTVTKTCPTHGSMQVPPVVLMCPICHRRLITS